MNLKVCSAVMLMATAFFSASAGAAYIQLAPGSQFNDGSIDLPPAGFTATYSPAASVSSIWFNGSVSPQSAASVAASIESQFGLTLTLAGQNDSFSSGNVSLPGTPFNVLAVHLGGAGGGNELLFFFDSPITAFEVNTFSQGGSNNLSNFRAYTSSPIPVPAAVWLMGSGLLGLVGMARRKKNAG